MDDSPPVFPTPSQSPWSLLESHVIAEGRQHYHVLSQSAHPSSSLALQLVQGWVCELRQCIRVALRPGLECWDRGVPFLCRGTERGRE